MQDPLTFALKTSLPFSRYMQLMNSHLVNENPGVCGQPGEGHNHVVVQQTDLPDRPVLLELGHSLLLHTKDDNIGTSHADSSGTFLDSLLGVLDLFIGIIYCQDF